LDGTYCSEGIVLLREFKHELTALVTGNGKDIRLYK